MTGMTTPRMLATTAALRSAVTGLFRQENSATMATPRTLTLASVRAHPLVAAMVSYRSVLRPVMMGMQIRLMPARRAVQ